MDEYLPIGTIVLLKGTTKRLMIYGRKQVHMESGCEFDYIGCLFPEGYINDDLVLFFNTNQIDKVVLEGLNDEEESTFVNTYLKHENKSAFS